MRGISRVGEGERDKKGMKRKTKEGRREIEREGENIRENEMEDENVEWRPGKGAMPRR